MGNRAVITFAKKPNRNSLGIYLHWNGGPESILAFVEAADKFKIRFGEESYALARLTQIIGNFFGGRTSIGVGTLARLDCDNGDNGIYRVFTTTDGSRLIFQCKRGWNPGAKWTEIDYAAARNHLYWRPTRPFDKPIVDQIIAANQSFFVDERDV